MSAGIKMRSARAMLRFYLPRGLNVNNKDLTLSAILQAEGWMMVQAFTRAVRVPTADQHERESE